mmetsp:Transcript_44081/g.75000  ORF Transcript_44081/g.75000 Transcript_44081/m.75000 type:complete len:167 (+) Transcript_44081:300-800(+)
MSKYTVPKPHIKFVQLLLWFIAPRRSYAGFILVRCSAASSWSGEKAFYRWRRGFISAVGAHPKHGEGLASGCSCSLLGPPLRRVKEDDKGIASAFRDGGNSVRDRTLVNHGTSLVASSQDQARAFPSTSSPPFSVTRFTATFVVVVIVFGSIIDNTDTFVCDMAES